jgi:hypothetical protein
MFNLEQSIAEWRRQMLAAGVKTPVPLDELESHLREEVEQQMRSGEGAQEAFESAVQRIGQPAVIQDEFAKAGSTRRRWLQELKANLLRFIGIRVPDPQAFTASAREILELGGNEARGFGHDFIGTEHLLLGLLESKTGFVPGIMERMGVDSKIVRSEIEKIVGNGLVQPASHSLPYTPRVKKALRLAAIESSALNQTQVGTEHIFLGLLMEGGGVAALVLKSLGVNIQRVREQILMQLGRHQSGA